MSTISVVQLSKAPAAKARGYLFDIQWRQQFTFRKFRFPPSLTARLSIYKWIKSSMTFLQSIRCIEMDLIVKRVWWFIWFQASFAIRYTHWNRNKSLPLPLHNVQSNSKECCLKPTWKVIYYCAQTAAIFFSIELLSKTGYWLDERHGWLHLQWLTRAMRNANRSRITK